MPAVAWMLDHSLSEPGRLPRQHHAGCESNTCDETAKASVLYHPQGFRSEGQLIFRVPSPTQGLGLSFYQATSLPGYSPVALWQKLRPEAPKASFSAPCLEGRRARGALRVSGTVAGQRRARGGEAPAGRPPLPRGEHSPARKAERAGPTRAPGTDSASPNPRPRRLRSPPMSRGGGPCPVVTSHPIRSGLRSGPRAPPSPSAGPPAPTPAGAPLAAAPRARAPPPTAVPASRRSPLSQQHHRPDRSRLRALPHPGTAEGGAAP